MPVFHFKPRVTSLDDPAWKNSTCDTKEMWLHARSLAHAREAMSERCEAADASLTVGELNPWLNSTLVDVTEVDEMPEGILAFYSGAAGEA